MRQPNNETDVIQPLHKVAELFLGRDVPKFVDTVQTAGKLHLPNIDADLPAVSARKFSRPRGVGALRI
ncbi:aminotransferase class V-fold PLP-dependent enzyme [Corynebacterium sp.]|uniref:aminotransferase class V-fold PLP-dependent enzyme n=1 Tax=Corynebacterium sp. TaxID=1720 RepID=UPI0034C60ADE